MKNFIISFICSAFVSATLLFGVVSYAQESTPVSYEKKAPKTYNRTRRCYPYDKYYLLKKWLPLYVIIGGILFIYLNEKKDKKLKKKIAELNRAIDSYEDQLGVKCLNQKERQKAGQEYEEYIARHLRRQGWRVTENGIKKGFDDEGIDLICKKANTPTLLVQCKNWADDKIVHENYIFELHGAAAYYKDREQEDIEVAFYATCPLSQKAKIVAVALGIKAHENFKILK